ncbi:MAG: type III-B CRISPR module RAMP protein Cmr6 [Burkholderiales bacterium]
MIDAESTAPFATGLGVEHPVENGFAFLSPYGLPYLAGSGVKGVVRRAAEELLGVGHPIVNALFGPEDAGTDEDSAPLDDAARRRGALTFWDVFPEPIGHSLCIEVMTPHHTTYYEGDSSPHDAGQPNPIPFLAVPPGSKFRFVATFDASYCPRNVELPDDWKALVSKAFVHAFDWLGFGAKTAVGYGAMRLDEVAMTAQEEQRRQKAADEARKQEEADDARRSPEDRAFKEHSRVIAAFRSAFESAKRSPYKVGGPFDHQRWEFVRSALSWTEPRSRIEAARLLSETMSKAWGMPSNKESKQKLQGSIADLNGTSV